MKRRAFLGAMAAVPLVGAPAPRQVIDTHTHFYDPSRSAGVPWPGKDEKRLYRTVLPREFAALTRQHGVTGTVVVEASPWLEDNQWILDLAADNPLIVGFIGHLAPGEPGFGNQLARFAKNPLFRGIRVDGALLVEGLSKQPVGDDLKRLGDAGLTLDVIGGREMLPAVADLAARMPDLKIVIDHLPFEPFAQKPDAVAYAEGLKRVAPHGNIYAKVSGVLRSDASQSGATLRMARIWRTFGEDRVLFASNWPVSDLAAPYRDVFAIVDAYFTAKGQRALDKFFWKNSVAAYNWVERGAARRQ